MKRIKQILIISSVFIMSVFIINMYAAGSSQDNAKITEKEIEPYKYRMTFIVKFSNIIYEKDGKNIKIPIFKGYNREVKYKDIISYCIEKKYIDQDMWVSYIIKCKKGEIKKTLHEFLLFYKSNILKDVDVDNFKNASLSSTEWTITYDFKMDGIPCYLKIQFDPREIDVNNEPKYKSVYEIVPEENIKDPNFTYQIIVGAKSTD